MIEKHVICLGEGWQQVGCGGLLVCWVVVVVLHGPPGGQPNARRLSGMFMVVERAKGVRCGSLSFPLWLRV